MKATACAPIGFKQIPGADHTNPVYHYRMKAGVAYKRQENGAYEPVEVSEAICKKAEQAFCLFWIQGHTVAEFLVGEDSYAQPIPSDLPAPERRPRKEASIVGKLREAKRGRVEAPRAVEPPPETSAATPRRGRRSACYDPL